MILSGRRGRLISKDVIYNCYIHNMILKNGLFPFSISPESPYNSVIMRGSGAKTWCGKRSRRDASPSVETLEVRNVPTAFTTTSPTSAGELPDGVSPVGGILLDLVGVNGRRVVSQLPASGLFRGMFNNGQPATSRGNPGLIGVQSGFTAQVLDALGGGLAEVAVRLTVLDGDTAEGNFDAGDNELLLNDVPLGNFSNVATQETTEDGATALSENPAGGFRNDVLDTGFFYSNDPDFLAGFFETLVSGTVEFRLRDVDPFENFFDFTQGVDASLITTSLAPTLVSETPTATIAPPTPATAPASPSVETPALPTPPLLEPALETRPQPDPSLLLAPALFPPLKTTAEFLTAPSVSRRSVAAVLIGLPVVANGPIVRIDLGTALSGGGGAAEVTPLPPVRADVLRQAVRQAGEFAANVLAGAASLGQGVADTVAAVAVRAVARVQAGVERLAAASRPLGERAQNPSEESEMPAQAAAPATAGRVGPVVRTTLLLLGTLLVQRRWSGSARLARLRRRRAAARN